MRIELHCHSLRSDGSLSPKEVAIRAREVGVQLFCLTDHDSCEGFTETLDVFPDAVQGLELSCVEQGRTVHLLMYRRATSKTWSRIEAALKDQREERRARVHAIGDRLAALGVHLDAQALVERTSGTIGRPHIAEELVRVGAVTSREEAFARYLKDGGPADVRVARLSLLQGLELGLEGGARMALAHPHSLGPILGETLHRYRGRGLEGLEVYYGLYKSKQRARYRQMSQEFDFVETGGV